MPDERKQIHVWLPTEMIDAIDEYGRKRGIRRSAAVAVLLAKALGRNGPTDGEASR